MYFLLGQPKQISALQGLDIQTTGALRAQIPVLVIDDAGFLYADVLRNHGFNIKVLTDITDVKAVESYPVIACDIKGVGKSFLSPYEGAHVLSEIRKHYPNKYLIAYTGQMFDASYNQYFALCDRSMKKDAESQTWVETLDQAIASYANPVEQWKKVRRILVDYEVPTLRLLQLEDQYVTAIAKKTRPFQDGQQLINLPTDAKNQGKK